MRLSEVAKESEKRKQYRVEEIIAYGMLLWASEIIDNYKIFFWALFHQKRP